MKGASSLVTGVLQLLSIGLSLAICIITSHELWWSWSGYLTVYGNAYEPATTYYIDKHLCLLSPLKSTNVCLYAWISSAYGLFVACVLIAIQCFPASRGCAMGEFLAALLSWVWWLAMAITTTVYGTNANETYTTITGRELGWPQKGYRTSIYAMAWAQFGLLSLQCLVSLKGLAGAKDQQPKKQEGYPQVWAEEGAPPTGAMASVPMPPADAGYKV